MRTTSATWSSFSMFVLEPGVEALNANHELTWITDEVMKGVATATQHCTKQVHVSPAHKAAPQTLDPLVHEERWVRERSVLAGVVFERLSTFEGSYHCRTPGRCSRDQTPSSH